MVRQPLMQWLSAVVFGRGFRRIGSKCLSPDTPSSSPIYLRHADRQASPDLKIVFEAHSKPARRCFYSPACDMPSKPLWPLSGDLCRSCSGWDPRKKDVCTPGFFARLISDSQSHKRLTRTACRIVEGLMSFLAIVSHDLFCETKPDKPLRRAVN